MSDDTQQLTDIFNHHEDDELFEMRFGVGGRGEVDYHVTSDGVWSIDRVEVFHVPGGRGLGSRLFAHTLEVIEARGAKVVPVCSFAVRYLEKHAEWHHLLADNVE